MEKYTDIRRFDNLNLTQFIDINLIEEELLEKVKAIKVLVDKFILKGKRTLISEICNYIIRNVENEISLGKISEALFLTKNYIGDIFKQDTGMAVGEYITIIDISKMFLNVCLNIMLIWERKRVLLGYKV